MYFRQFSEPLFRKFPRRRTSRPRPSILLGFILSRHLLVLRHSSRSSPWPMYNVSGHRGPPKSMPPRRRARPRNGVRRAVPEPQFRASVRTESDGDVFGQTRARDDDDAADDGRVQSADGDSGCRGKIRGREAGLRGRWAELG